jgi:CDGSH-type Zn-finger protein
MSSKKETPSSLHDSTERIRVSKNGPYIVSGGVPLIKKEIRNDSEGYCSSWHEVEIYPLQEQYALCRCGKSYNKPFCDGRHIGR